MRALPFRLVRRPALRRRLLPAALGLALLAGSLPGATPAQADSPGRSAAAEVAALRQEVRAASAALLAGTRRLEADRATLARVQRQASSARRAAGQADAQVSRSRRRLAVVVAAAYRRPAPDDVVLALGSGPDALHDALVARADLDHVRGSEQDLLRSATAETVRARSLVRSASQLEQETRRRESALARRVAALQGQAARAETRLTRAAGRLESARRASRARRVALATGGATCDGGGTGGAPNGFLPTSALCPVGNGHRLRADAAAAFLRMNAERPLCITDSYRTFGEQVSVYRRKPGLAAVPGTSNHGRGIALDLGCGAERFGSDTYRWLKANGPRFGWTHPAWAEPGGSKPEPWHWEYLR